MFSTDETLALLESFLYIITIFCSKNYDKEREM